jgi:ATP-dependent Lon protease
MAYNLRSSKKLKYDKDYDPPDEQETDLTSLSDSTETDMESFDDVKDQFLNRLLGVGDDHDNLTGANLYHTDHYEKSDNHFIDLLPENMRAVYREKLKNLRTIQIAGYVTLADIISSAIPDEKKSELVVLYDQLKQFPYYTDEFIAINKKIKKNIEYYAATKSVFADDENELADKIRTARISDHNREKLMRKLFSLQKCESNEKHDLLSYIDYGLRIINEPHIDASVSLADYSALASTIKQNLDALLFGQDKAKEEIIDNVISRLINPDIGNISVFQGSPGVGKTHTARNLAKILGYKFHQISLGSVSDAYSITGSLSTYVGSRPGEIYNAVSSMGCDNGIIFLDEFDKIFDMARTATNSSLENVFLNILDPSQNSAYKDNHLPDLNIDLSKIWFIISVNDLDHIRGPIRDRLRPVISFNNYTLDNRISIARQFLVPDTLRTYMINPETIHIDDSVYKLICEGGTGIRETGIRETGIREVKSVCELLFKRINTLILTTGYKPSYFINFKRTVEGKLIINSDVVKKLADCAPKEKDGRYLSFYS